MTDRSVVLLIDAVVQGHGALLKPKIEDRGFRAHFWNLSAAKTLQLNLAVPEVRVQVGSEGQRIALDELRSVWINTRYPSPDSLPQNLEFRAFAQDEWEAALCNLFHFTRHLPWVNPLDRDYISGAKVYQLDVARRAGLRVPRTLVTLDPEEFRAFLRSCPEGVAIKRLNDSPSMYRTNSTPWMIYTNRIREADLPRLAIDSIRVAPCHFQEYVPKQSELRVYVVGDRIFSVEIFSQLDKETEVDWRRYPRKAGPMGWEIDFDRWRCSTVELPASVNESCRQVARELGIRYAAIDLIKSKDGQYVFLEANNPGAWGWLELRTGLPITDAIVDLLVGEGESSATPSSSPAAASGADAPSSTPTTSGGH